MALREQLAEKRDWVTVSGPAALFPSPKLRLVQSDRWAPQAPRSAAAYLLAKWLTDVTLSVMALLLLAPLFLAIAFAIRLDSSGPAIFRQWRVGLDGRIFRIWKFRTLSVVEDGDNIAQVTKADPRVTRVGRLLRRTSIDELPQLINVLRGEMALVGPRPHAHAHDRYFVERIENYAVRHSVKPGITGWAQVNGLRGETATLEEMRRRVSFDLWYVREASFAFDLRILLATPGAVLLGRNAW
ncbi:MAG TPA: exopolysaccharide biosynthesis polyprenyl glycosylphosphotransferase [Rhizomicrobium sp.]|nr:exopolysaccharide biosynthesis polyprenyl glycosylphosphotransferase [Rhizomicrobium sp.]